MSPRRPRPGPESGPGAPDMLYVCGSIEDLEQLTRYLSNATALAPFNAVVVLVRLARGVALARTRHAGVHRIPLPVQHAEPLRAWLEKDALRLAEAGYLTMSALIQRVSFEP